ncbi:MAG: PIG-L family deacetylase [Firmicutes bacterium]|nr:PIG-L family deacetylase [Bacillota bacterium]
MKIRRTVRIAFTAVLAALLCFSLAFAGDRAEEEGVDITAAGFSSNKVFTDDLRKTYATAKAENSVTIRCEKGLSSVYIEFDTIPDQNWTVTSSATGQTAECGGKGFLHDFTDIQELLGEHPTELVLKFAEGTGISNIYAFSGEAPDWVQKWEPMHETADIMLVSTHADDEQLFFAGLLPYYAVERKVDVQVVYFVQHFHKAHKVFDHVRPHEQLDGLWTVGIRNYPYMSEFPDVYGEGSSRANALSNILSSFKYYGYTQDDFMRFAVDTIRKFRPHVIVTHDFNGEYGHAAHMLNADTFSKAVELSGDASKYPESVAEYGTWTPDKLYVHLYKENAIVMDWDTPYESLGGLTPFQVTQKGFDCHETQTIYWFWTWLCGTRSNPITKASQINKYSPCKFGLYFTNVGPDVKGGDFLENVYTYAQQRIDEAEAEKKRQEEEEARKKAEEEAERKRKEEEAERKRQEEAQKALEAQKRRRIMIAAGCFIAAALVALITKGRRKK